MNRWSATGKLRAIVGREFTLGEAAAAEQFLEDNTLGFQGKLTGKVVVRVAGRA
jgi:NADPH2:quinone reductase